MKVMEEVKKKIEKIDYGKIITYQDLKISQDKFEATAKALSRLNKEGIIKRLSKGLYYKPEKTPFGFIKPSEKEVIKHFTEKTGKAIGYVTGNNIYNKMGLTTQLTNEVLISCNNSRREIKINGIKIRFKNNNNKISKNDINNLQILDAIKDIKKIPDNNINDTILIIINKIKNLDNISRKKLYIISFKYNPSTRALVGAILELIESSDYTIKLKKTLNKLTKYKIGINEKILPNKKIWNIE